VDKDGEADHSLIECQESSTLPAHTMEEEQVKEWFGEFPTVGRPYKEDFPLGIPCQPDTFVSTLKQKESPIGLGARSSDCKLAMAKELTIS
jgi:ribosomal protein L16 Arg81 hydroxylase